jgi:hypothetical protein
MMKKIFYTTLLVLLSYASFSQELNNTLYFMSYSPQANYLNPSITPEAEVWIGLPVISSFAFQYNNNSFHLEDILVKKGNDIKNVKIDVNNFYNALALNSTINMSTELSLLSFGLRMGNDYISLDIKHKNSMSFGFDKSFIGFFNAGNTAFKGQTVDLGNTQMNSLAYNEIAFGYSHLIDAEHNFTVGAKLKVIMGIASLDMTDSSIALDIASDGMSTNVRANSHVRLAGPVKFKGFEGAEFEIDDMEFDDSNIASTVIGIDNLGFALDIGAQYTFNEKISVYASILDIGYINWDNGYRINMAADYIWDGGDFSGQIKDSSVDAIEDLLDDLEDEFKLRKEDKSFIQALPTKVYVGGQYIVNDWFKAGLLNRTQFYNGNVYSALTASGNFKTCKRLSASVSYTYANNSFSNVGFGFTAQAGPMQLYLVTDNIIAANFTSAQLVNFRMGLNIRFGLNKEAKKEVERNQ